MGLSGAAHWDTCLGSGERERRARAALVLALLSAAAASAGTGFFDLREEAELHVHVGQQLLRRVQCVVRAAARVMLLLLFELHLGEPVFGLLALHSHAHGLGHRAHGARGWQRRRRQPGRARRRWR
jgi:hypothetical protein